MPGTWWISYKLSQLLVADLGASHLLNGGALSPDYAARTIAAMPPLVDLDRDEIEQQWSKRGAQYWQLRVSLRTVDGPTGVSLIVDLCDDHILGLVGFDGTVPAPVHALPTPRPDGRIPRELWVGSPGLRFDRLLQGMPETNDRWDVDCPSQALFLLDYADSDINNGTLFQFYGNGTGNFADRFPEWARRVGSPDRADIVAEANLLFYGIDIRDWQARNNRLAELAEITELGTPEDPLLRLTRRYNACEEASFPELGVAYVDRHPDDFLM